MPQPLFIVAPHRSFTSIVCAMLGQHPQMYGLPEMNLFVAESLREWWAIYRTVRHYEGHGVLRAVAQLYFGEQTEDTIELARWWLLRRLHWDTGLLFMALAETVHPLMLVDKSPFNVARREYLRRLHRTFPGAKFLHLLRHPRGYGESLIDLLLKTGTHPQQLNSRLAAGGDPQKRWYSIHMRINTFLAPLPEEQKMRMRGEDLLSDPDQHLRELTEWLGLRADTAAIEQMRHPERSPFACFGPPNARLGNDPHFLERPILRANGLKPQSLEGPLQWRMDGSEFLPEVRELARAFGYE